MNIIKERQRAKQREGQNRYEGSTNKKKIINSCYMHK